MWVKPQAQKFNARKKKVCSSNIVRADNSFKNMQQISFSNKTSFLEQPRRKIMESMEKSFCLLLVKIFEGFSYVVDPQRFS